MRFLNFTVWAAGMCAAAAGLCAAANAQPVRKEPARYAGTERASRGEARPPGIRLGLRKAREVALAPLSGFERARLAEPGPRLRTGIHRALPAHALDSGGWETTSEGKRLWRMAIRSPGAEGVRVEFRDFSVGNGKVWLDDGVHAAGPYTGRGVFGDGHFWSATVFSEAVTIEYEPDPDAPETAELPFEVAAISHRAARAALESAKGDPADYCHLDPNCYPDWQGAMSTVAELTFEEGGDQYLCSGSLVATRDNSFKPYLLTAGHCVSSEAAARTLEAYWNYQTSACGATPPSGRGSSTLTSLGAHLLDSGTIENGDYSLVLLKDVPGGVTFAGWDTADPPQGTPLTGIHHPKGSWKRISFGERTGDMTADVGDSAAPAGRYLEVLWDKGRTEPGSSGSPLFSSPGVIVGTLTYGPESPTLSACQIDPSVDGYGRFSNTYQYLKDYLEDLPAALITPDKPELSFSVVNGTAPAAQTVLLTTQTAGQVQFKLRADAPWIRFPAATGTVSAGAPAQVEIMVDPAAFDSGGTYSSTVTILSGAAAPQFIEVTAAARVDQSNVTATITPGTVVQSGGLWNFRIRLAETAGAPARVTAMSIDGKDYSANVRAWFGTDHIAGKGAIEAPLSAGAGFPSGTQYFEFWGVDDLTGRQWYRVATVEFQ